MSTAGSKNQHKQAEHKQKHRYRKYFDGCQMGGGLGEGGKGEGIKKYKVVVTEQSRRCEVQRRESSSQRTYTHDPWSRTTVWGLPEGVGRYGWRRTKRVKLGQL